MSGNRCKILVPNEERTSRTLSSPSLKEEPPLKVYAESRCAVLWQNCVKTLSVLGVGVSFRAKSRCPKLLEINESGRKR